MTIFSQRDVKAHLVPFIGFIAVVFVVFGQALFAPPGEMIMGDDIHRTYYFFKQFFADSIRAGTFPWWNPYLFSGAPFAAHPQAVLPFYPPNWLFVAMPKPLAFSWYLAAHVVFAMVGVYWFCRKHMGTFASWAAGLVFGLSGYFMARIWGGHLDMVAAASWIPWVFGLFWEGSIFAGVALTMQLFSGYQTIALFTLEAVAIATVLTVINTRSLIPVRSMLIAILIGVGLAGIQLIPEAQFAALSIRSFPLGYEWTSGFAVSWDELKLLLNPFLYGNQHTYAGQWPNLSEYLMFIGRIPLGIALTYALWMVSKRKRNLLPWVIVVIGVFAIWVSFGPNAPVDLLRVLWKVIPPYQVFRLPSRHLVLFVFSASVLAGFGVNVIRNKIIQRILVAAIAVELVPFAMGFVETRPIPQIRHDSELISILQKDITLYRLLPNFGVWLPPRDSLDFDASLTYKIFSVTGYDPSIIRHYYEFIDAANGREGSSILEHNVQVPYLDVTSPYINFLNVKYILVPSNSERGWELTENKNVWPRFYLVSQSVMLPSRESQSSAIRERAYDLRTVVLLSKEAPVLNLSSRCPEGDVVVGSYTPNGVRLAVDTACDSYLVSSEVYYPGWEAYVDGKKTEIFEANMAFRTLFVPKGNHRIDLVYSPKIFVIGGMVSLVTLVGMLMWARLRAS